MTMRSGGRLSKQPAKASSNASVARSIGTRTAVVLVMVGLLAVACMADSSCDPDV